jgi:hypothetical protein
MARAGGKGWFSSSAPDHIIAHEVVHAEHFKALGKDQFEQAKKLRFRPEHIGTAQKVSRYAATKPVEFVAEVGAGLKAGKTYDADVMGMYRKLGGPRP